MAGISVACKLPSGLIIEQGEKSVTLVGSADASAIGGYGITRNVDEALFDAWLKDHVDFAPVKAGLIFKAADAGRAGAQAREMAAVNNGMEGLDPSKPGPGIEPTDETKKALAEQDPDAPVSGKPANRGRGGR